MITVNLLNGMEAQGMDSDMDHLLTPAQKRAKTMEAKKKSMLEQMGVDTTPKKVKRKRKPMTAEQREAAAERLALARAKKNKGKEPSAHPRVLELDPDHPLSYYNIKEQLKEWRDKVKSIRHQKDSKESSQRLEFQIAENYVKNLGIWLRDGVWCDNRYGAARESVMEYVCYAPACDKDGNVKRDVGVFYSDIGKTWTKELAEEHRA